MVEGLYPMVRNRAKEALVVYDVHGESMGMELATALRWLLACLDQRDELVAEARQVSAGLTAQANELDEEQHRYGSTAAHYQSAQLRKAAAIIDSLLS
jgi:hypothetical protein